MFTFTKRADYAMLALSYLANIENKRLAGPREIATRHEIPQELLAKILQALAKRRLVASVPGPTGGYKLARPAREISLADVVEAVDGPLAIAQCWEDDGPDGCAQSRQCHLRGPLARIQEEMTKLLRAMTLEEVLGPPRRQYTGRHALTVLPSEGNGGGGISVSPRATAGTLNNGSPAKLPAPMAPIPPPVA